MSSVFAALLAASFFQHATVTEDQGAPTAETAVAASAPEPELTDEDREDAARDLKDSRFYNKPGATRAEYERDWNECRLIARGSRTPGGVVVVPYNSAIISPAVAAGAGALGGLLGGAIAEGSQRRQNRQTCLLVRGWALVDVDDATKKRIAAMTDAERNAFFEDVVGSTRPGMRKIRWTNEFAAPRVAPVD